MPYYGEIEDRRDRETTQSFRWACGVFVVSIGWMYLLEWLFL